MWPLVVVALAASAAESSEVGRPGPLPSRLSGGRDRSSRPPLAFTLGVGTQLSARVPAVMISAAVDADAVIDDVLRVEFHVFGRYLADRLAGGAPYGTFSVLVSSRFSLAFASLGVATLLQPAVSSIDFASGPSLGVRLFDRDDVLVRVVFNWLPAGLTWSATRAIAELWGGWKFLGLQLAATPIVLDPSSGAFFSAALCMRLQT